MPATMHVLHTGYVGPEEPDGMRVGSTVVFAEQGDRKVIVDPGMVADRQQILGPLGDLGVRPDDITDVVFSHQHIDHTLNAALFPGARFHDFAAVYRDDLWSDDDAEGRVIAPDITLILTPGHTNEDLSTLIRTDSGLVVCTHAWWSADGPDEDPYAPDQSVLQRSRRRILDLSPALVVPGHGAPFVPA